MNCPVCGESMGSRGYVVGAINGAGQRVCTPNVLRLTNPEHYIEALTAHGLTEHLDAESLEREAWQRWIMLFQWTHRSMWDGRGQG